MKRYGFTEEQLRTICVRFPALLSYSWQRTHGNARSPGLLLLLERYGFTRPQVLSMCARFPTLLGYSWQRTHGSDCAPGILLRLEDAGHSRAQVRALCAATPIVLGCRWERTAAQLRMATTFGLPLSTQLFLCSPEKTRWRWGHLTGPLGRTPAQARAAVFLSHTVFLRRFGCDYEPGAGAATPVVGRRR